MMSVFCTSMLVEGIMLISSAIELLTAKRVHMQRDNGMQDISGIDFL